MVVATIKCNIMIENERVSNLKHWPKSTPCTMCKIDLSIRSSLDWRALRDEIPSVIVSVLIAAQCLRNIMEDENFGLLLDTVSQSQQ